MSKKAIITCAITGGVHTPSMSPYLPVTPEQIASEAVAAAEAGAAIIHLHARHPEDGRPDPSPARYMEFLPAIKERTNAILNVTTGGGQGMTLEERYAAAVATKPELASMNMGSFNFALFEAVDRIPNFKHAWERTYLEGSKNFILSNTFAQIEYGMRMLSDHGTRFEFECYDVGHLYNLAHFVDRGLVKPPFFVQCIFGILGAIGPDPENLLHMRATADRLFGKDYRLSVLAAGRHQMPFVTLSAILGGNVRVGLEDSLSLGRGKLAKSNADQVSKIRRILDELGIDIATPDEAREMLQTKGAANVGF
ncbi:3-keto-5-aminohexanoate cleavage protein [Gemmobacter aquaticus]|uniref:3-keto-5-aminohexanoate cleavage protein n=1 Tax=Gemmobacter aquaticus TaxID=490185 RepID=A0A917YG06_9RHOB|nr:3-keto-5-aminohexanoate cleavage protein [Gemmobacter aquaticus]GGO24203.1 3-keto-5-aminohexanoate cleavage protein [Gemmobacter aquaticus]